MSFALLVPGSQTPYKHSSSKIRLSVSFIMSHTLTIHNKSPHNQEFEVHGWNNNRNILVSAHSSTNINAPDGSSGAIIALHDGHEGEQAEITKKGYGGNDYFDVSNITGAGGNMTVMQKNDPETIKGHPLFMQALNRAWLHADQKTKDDIKRSIHMDHTGKIVRMDATKDNANLEAFVHAFDKLSYVGVGSWNGRAGNADDNAQVTDMPCPRTSLSWTADLSIESCGEGKQGHPDHI